MIELDFGDTPGKLKGEYLNMYGGVRSEVLHTTKFDENSDLNTTYLGRVEMARSDKGRGKISYTRTRIHGRKIAGWYRMSNTFGYRSK